jgi:hypothetical protein
VLRAGRIRVLQICDFGNMWLYSFQKGDSKGPLGCPGARTDAFRSKEMSLIFNRFSRAETSEREPPC